MARRRELLHSPDVKEMYEWRKGLLLKIEETRRQEQEVEERMRSVASMAETLNKRLQELLKLAETKTREYVGRDVELETA